MKSMWLLVAVGGAMGSVLRFALGSALSDWLGRGFPHATLMINVSGSFMMGLLTQMLLFRYPESHGHRAVLLVGFLGGYTTFSSFSLETVQLFESGQIWRACTYIMLSVGLCLGAVWLGGFLGQKIFFEEMSLLSWHPLFTLLSLTLLFSMAAGILFSGLSTHLLMDVLGEYVAALLVMGVGSLMVILYIAWVGRNWSPILSMPALIETTLLTLILAFWLGKRIGNTWLFTLP